MMEFETAYEKRVRAVSAEGLDQLKTNPKTNVSSIPLCLAGIRGRYSGGINESGRPHGAGYFVRDEGGMKYVGMWKDGERFGNGEYYNVEGNFLGNVVWG